MDQNVDPHVVSDDGPVMSQYACRSAMQRSVAKVFYNAGFEEYQPSAIDAVTDIATDFLVKLGRSFKEYMSQPKVPVVENVSGSPETKVKWKRKYSLEESILQSLNENGIELEALDTYAKEDADRFSSKLSTMHERMKAHLSELLRPALTADAGPDGVNAFNDGSEQFVGGDFAEDLGEDFFGFKELGLDKEFGLAGLSVPLHLLQNRMHNAYQAQSTRSIYPLNYLLFDADRRPVLQFPQPPPSQHPHHSSPSLSKTSATKSVSYSASSRRGYRPTTISHLPKTKTCHKNSACPSRVYRQPAKSPLPASVPSARAALARDIRKKRCGTSKARAGSSRVTLLTRNAKRKMARRKGRASRTSKRRTSNRSSRGVS